MTNQVCYQILSFADSAISRTASPVIGIMPADSGNTDATSTSTDAATIASSFADSDITAGSSFAASGITAGSSFADSGITAGSSFADSGITAGSPFADSGIAAGSSFADSDTIAGTGAPSADSTASADSDAIYATPVDVCVNESCTATDGHRSPQGTPPNCFLKPASPDVPSTQVAEQDCATDATTRSPIRGATPGDGGRADSTGVTSDVANLANCLADSVTAGTISPSTSHKSSPHSDVTNTTPLTESASESFSTISEQRSHEDKRHHMFKIPASTDVYSTNVSEQDCATDATTRSPIRSATPGDGGRADSTGVTSDVANLASCLADSGTAGNISPTASRKSSVHSDVTNTAPLTESASESYPTTSEQRSHEDKTHHMFQIPASTDVYSTNVAEQDCATDATTRSPIRGATPGDGGRADSTGVTSDVANLANCLADSVTAGTISPTTSRKSSSHSDVTNTTPLTESASKSYPTISEQRSHEDKRHHRFQIPASTDVYSTNVAEQGT
ncbi:papilin-like [Ambystoma mexicanum]|uniref:papilin-like n=1 Tax=Ambystoma mexicanum TaxID=8296 RepID=UPI0037E716F1